MHPPMPRIAHVILLSIAQPLPLPHTTFSNSLNIACIGGVINKHTHVAVVCLSSGNYVIHFTFIAELRGLGLPSINLFRPKHANKYVTRSDKRVTNSLGRSRRKHHLGVINNFYQFRVFDLFSYCKPGDY